MRKTVSGLYAVTPALADSALLTSKVEAALRGGARILQYRNKAADEQLRHEQAVQIGQCRARRVHQPVRREGATSHEEAKQQHRRDCSAGHLIEGQVRPTLEVILTDSPAHLRKKHNPESGLALIEESAIARNGYAAVETAQVKYSVRTLVEACTKIAPTLGK